MSITWVDEETKPLPTPDTWGTLSLNNLLDVKNQMLDKAYLARGKPVYLAAINTALGKLDALISEKLSDPRGSS